MKTETKTKQAVLKEFILTFCMVIDDCSDGLTPASQCSEAWGGDPYIKPSFFFPRRQGLQITQILPEWHRHCDRTNLKSHGFYESYKQRGGGERRKSQE